MPKIRGLTFYWKKYNSYICQLSRVLLKKIPRSRSLSYVKKINLFNFYICQGAEVWSFVVMKRVAEFLFHIAEACTADRTSIWNLFYHNLMNDCEIFFKGSVRKNKRGYRLTSKNIRWWLQLILLLSVVYIRRKLLKRTHNEEPIWIQKVAIFDLDQFNFKQIIQILQPIIIVFFSIPVLSIFDNEDKL